MASLRSISSYLAERAGRTRDYPFIREMEDAIVIKRARFLANALSKNNGKSRFYLQKLKIPIKKIDLTDECASEISPDCIEKAYRSKEKVPLPVQFGVHPFEYVGPVGGFKGYGWTTFGTEGFLKKRPLVGKNPRYTYSNEFLYLFNKDIDYIQVEGVFPDPRLIKKFQSCNEDNKPCWSEEREGFVEEQLAEMIITELLAQLRGIPDEPIQVKPDRNV